MACARGTAASMVSIRDAVSTVTCAPVAGCARTGIAATAHSAVTTAPATLRTPRIACPRGRCKCRPLCEKHRAGASLPAPRPAPPDPMQQQTVSEFALDPADTERLANLAGPFDAHLRLLELRLGVEIGNRGNVFRIAGPLASVSTAERVLRELWRDTSEEVLTEPGIHVRLG